jgi:hypothetical protein
MPFIKLKFKDGDSVLIPIDSIVDVYSDKDGVTVNTNNYNYSDLDCTIDEIHELIRAELGHERDLTPTTDTSLSDFEYFVLQKTMKRLLKENTSLPGRR